MNGYRILNLLLTKKINFMKNSEKLTAEQIRLIAELKSIAETEVATIVDGLTGLQFNNLLKKVQVEQTITPVDQSIVDRIERYSTSHVEVETPNKPGTQIVIGKLISLQEFKGFFRATLKDSKSKLHHLTVNDKRFFAFDKESDSFTDESRFSIGDVVQVTFELQKANETTFTVGNKHFQHTTTSEVVIAVSESDKQEFEEDRKLERIKLEKSSTISKKDLEAKVLEVFDTDRNSEEKKYLAELLLQIHK